MNLLRFVKLIKEFSLLKSYKKWLYIKVFVMTFINRRKILKNDFKVVARGFGYTNTESTRIIDKEKIMIIKEISEATLKVSNHTPWKSSCMIKAMTAKKLLDEKGIDSTIYLGVTKEDEKLKAHAWLRCGEISVTGGNGAGFAIVNYFSGISKK